MPAALLAWLIAHQAIAATLTVYLGLTAAGIDVAEKVIGLEHAVRAEHVVPKVEEPAP